MFWFPGSINMCFGWVENHMKFLEFFHSFTIVSLRLVLLLFSYTLQLKFKFYSDILSAIPLSLLILFKSIPKEGVGIPRGLLRKVFLQQVRNNKVLRINN
jgi:hypothetical protein